ncbi:hypothetical protein G7046_g3455 [Stylonectria norvegica]|nr:hypothetical protein G7046_g3455 [Stylonectria norvegica]
MGYTQNWKIKSEKRWLEVWPKLVQDARLILDAADVDLTSDRVWDALEAKSEYGDDAAAIDKLLRPPRPVVDDEEGIIFNGIHTDGCEPFVLCKTPVDSYSDNSFQCKTNERPYDSIACTILLRAKQLLQSSFSFLCSSYDGNEGWEKAVYLVQVLWSEDAIPDLSIDDWDDSYVESTVPKASAFLEPPVKISQETNKQSAQSARSNESVPRVVDSISALPSLPTGFSENHIQRMIRWLEECNDSEVSHAVCHLAATKRSPLLRLVDVDKNCIVTAPQDAQYVALSYVWGASGQTCLLKGNIDALSKEDGLKHSSKPVSQAISEAMIVTQRLGYRYIWVDALCILQDSPRDKIFQLNGMRDVYRDAALTLVAASGDGAASPLITKPLADTFAEDLDLEAWFEESISQSTWNTRGWTFQEKLLSRRLLTFTSTDVFFQCGVYIYARDKSQRLSDLELSKGFMNCERPGCLSDIKSGRQLETYLALVQKYSRRRLTSEADFANAMKGISRIFGYSMDGKANSFFEGIPSTAFDNLFCWRVEEHQPMSRRDEFPNWSWQGWKQKPIFPDALIKEYQSKGTDSTGSRLMGYDRRREPATSSPKVSSLAFGMNDSGPMPLYLFTKAGDLEVSFRSSSDIGATNALYEVSSPHNGLVVGTIQLDKDWRAKQPGMIKFMPIFGTVDQNVETVTLLMCLEPCKTKGDWVIEGYTFERVQIMDCQFRIEDDILDVLIVGAGPCGLAIAARLREHTPAALFTDEEHRRYHWISKYGKKMTLKHVKSGKVTAPPHAARPEYKMMVLDADDTNWMGRWKRLFKTYDISHLRSPMLWHVDPQDRDALLSHAYSNEREDELVEIKHCVGKEISKHARKRSTVNRACGGKQAGRISINLRERNDYYTPSQPLFCDHCEKVADRYKLSSDLIRKESVDHIDYGVVKGISLDDEKLFTITTNQVRRYARTVVLAVGPANVPKIPRIPSMPEVESLPQVCHSMHIGQFPAPIVQAKIDARRQTNILIVGGGLTSAQLSDLAIRRGVTKVWHIMRGPLRIKHFDVSLEWMGKFKNAEQARFWAADEDDERLEIIKEARGGGSITPLFHKRLKKHIATGKLELHTMTSLVDAKFEGVDGKGTWTVKTSPPIESLPSMDYIYFATGIQTDFASLPYLQTLLEKHPIEGRGGFPCINDDLMWNDDVPLFMMGRLSSLKIGPAAPNLGGAKVGAERIAWAIEDLIPRPGAFHSDGLDAREDGGGMGGYLSGHGNMYNSLVCE